MNKIEKNGQKYLRNLSSVRKEELHFLYNIDKDNNNNKLNEINMLKIYPGSATYFSILDLIFLSTICKQFENNYEESQIVQTVK